MNPVRPLFTANVSNCLVELTFSAFVNDLNISRLWCFGVFYQLLNTFVLLCDSVLLLYFASALTPCYLFSSYRILQLSPTSVKAQC